MNTTTPQEQSSRQGFSLLMVLLLIIAIAAIMAPVAVRVKTDALHASSLLRIDEQTVLARGLSVVLVSQAIKPRSEDQTRSLVPNSTPYACHVGGIEIEYSLQDHAGLIDLNRASAELLAHGFRALDFDIQSARLLAQTVLAFREFRRREPNNPSLEIIGGPKSAPFDSVSELSDIREMRRTPSRDLTRVFTTYSMSSRVNSELAPADLRRNISGTNSPISEPIYGNTLDNPFTASVTVRSGGLEGRFVGVYRATDTFGARLLETWRYDLAGKRLEPVDEGNCAIRFGPAVEQLIARTV